MHVCMFSFANNTNKFISTYTRIYMHTYVCIYVRTYVRM